ncbi:esterase/lipase [Ilyonectria robusta]|uniref:esterase/lipase n=1 Tax=Ilyonectria robusta TaxID=1079257 RepID=UPI001E8CA8A6|nr:esterase/lipase [Ilyonectria robusta]KAH8694368.1 esterase/lipase [Ilyonectria robusta]
MASNPIGSCCYQGVKHEGQPYGHVETVGETETYIVEPKSSNGFGLIFLTDIIGHKFVNAQLIADQFAANGYTVLIPDLFHGDPVPLNADMATFSLPDWMQGKLGAKNIPHIAETVDPVVAASLKFLKEKYNPKKVAAVGYCFGAKYVVRGLGSGSFDAGYIAHPAMVSMEELEAIKGPLSIAAAEVDDIFPTNLRHDSEAVLLKTGTPYQLNVYSGVNHGFAVRCDLSDKRQKYAKESAFLLVLQWFNEYLN